MMLIIKDKNCKVDIIIGEIALQKVIKTIIPNLKFQLSLLDGSPVTCCRSDTKSPDGSKYDTSDHADNQRQDLQDGRDDHDKRESGTGGDQYPSKQMLVYMDDSSPTTCCNLLRRVISSNYSGSIEHLKFPFDVKLAFLVFCVAPTFFYLVLPLPLTLKRRVFDETVAKAKALLDGLQLF